MSLKIIEQLELNKFVVELCDEPEVSIDHVGIVHDYVEFSGRGYLHSKNASKCKIQGHGCVSNILGYETSIQIPIRMFYKTVLPLLNNDNYLQERHFEDRIHTEDSIANPPKFKKGDVYPTYAYHERTILSYWDKDKNQRMVSILLKGEREPSIVTYEFYKKFVEPTLIKK